MNKISNKSTTSRRIGKKSENASLNKSRINESLTGSKASLVRQSHAILGKVKPQEANVVVYDESGNDVTPVSLFAAIKAFNTKGTNNNESSTMTSTTKDNVADVLATLDTMSGSWGGSMFSKSKSQSSKSSISSETSEEDEKSSHSSSDSLYRPRDAKTESLTILKSKKNPTDSDPNKIISILLTETETITLLNLPALSVSNESIDEVTAIRTSNARYKELKSSKINNDNYVDRSMQTFNKAHKNKDVQAASLKQIDCEIMTTSWSIYDAYYSSEFGNLDTGKDLDMENCILGTENIKMLDEASGQLIHASTTDVGMGSTATSMSLKNNSRVETQLSSMFANDVPDTATTVANTIIVEKDLKQFNQQNLLLTFLLMEKAVIANNYEKRLISYRDIPDKELLEEKRLAILLEKLEKNLYEEEEDNEIEEPVNEETEEKSDASNWQSVQLLWTYRCELTRGRSVMYMALNKINEDILAVAYSSPDYLPNSNDGLILCWSIKNPEWPERIYNTSSTVTAIDFSLINPSLLAAGFEDGRIVIYNVWKRDDGCFLDVGDLNGKHHDPVWELNWVNKDGISDENTSGETLVSVSTDGRVTQWQIRKGMEYTDLMQLKSINKTVNSSNQKSASFISRQSGGLSFDFNPKDPNNYLVGTEDGNIHRCSSSYNEQYLDSYIGHTGPVYKVRWSPFVPGTFLSCSSDWTVRLWNQDEEFDMFKFQNGKDAVTDVAWSPVSSTIFGCVSIDGRLEIWSLTDSVLDPIIVQTVLDRQLKTLKFGSQAPVIFTGDDNGVVHVYKLKLGKVEYSTAHLKDKANYQEWKDNQNEALQAIIETKIAGLTTSL